MVLDIPPELLSGPFRLADALKLGVSSRVLRTDRFVRLYRGVYVGADHPMVPMDHLRAAYLSLPDGLTVSHLSAARVWGLSVRGREEPQFSANRDVRAAEGIRVHIRRGRLHPVWRERMAVTQPDRTLVDCAVQMSLVELVQFGDHLLRERFTTAGTLAAYAAARHLDGVQRARLVVPELRAASESPMESLVRICLVLAGLPEFEANVDIQDRDGGFVARVDLIDRRTGVVVEYDGVHHERDARQRQRDRERREQLEALGHRLIVVTNADLADLREVVWRVWTALHQRGHRGAPPEFGWRWRYWHATPKISYPK